MSSPCRLQDFSVRAMYILLYLGLVSWYTYLGGRFGLAPVVRNLADDAAEYITTHSMCLAMSSTAFVVTSSPSYASQYVSGTFTIRRPTSKKKQNLDLSLCCRFREHYLHGGSILKTKSRSKNNCCIFRENDSMGENHPGHSYRPAQQNGLLIIHSRTLKLMLSRSDVGGEIQIDRSDWHTTLYHCIPHTTLLQNISTFFIEY